MNIDPQNDPCIVCPLPDCMDGTVKCGLFGKKNQLRLDTAREQYAKNTSPIKVRNKTKAQPEQVGAK